MFQIRCPPLRVSNLLQKVWMTKTVATFSQPFLWISFEEFFDVLAGEEATLICFFDL